MSYLVSTLVDGEYLFKSKLRVVSAVSLESESDSLETALSVILAFSYPQLLLS